MRYFFLLLFILFYGCGKKPSSNIPEDMELPLFPQSLWHIDILNNEWNIDKDIFSLKPPSTLTRLQEFTVLERTIKNLSHQDPYEYIITTPFLNIQKDLENVDPYLLSYIGSLLKELDVYVFYYKLKYSTSPPNILSNKFSTQIVPFAGFPSRIAAHDYLILDILSLYEQYLKQNSLPVTFNINNIIEKLNILEESSVYFGYKFITDIQAGRILAKNFINYYFSDPNNHNKLLDIFELTN